MAALRAGARVAALDAAHVWHPYTQHLGAAPPVPIVRAEGALLFDAAGRPIIDAISSWWVTLHGHAHPAIARAVAEQAARLDQVIFTAFTHEPAAALAAELVARLPEGLTRVFYSDDGSTAVEVALKIALQYWANRGEPRRRIAALTHAYHGDTFGAMSASAPSTFTAPFADQLFDIVRLPAPDDGDGVALLRALDVALDAPGDPLAAVIVEPRLQGAGGMRVWSAGLLRDIRARTLERGALLIADEVLTGFGRTGPLFASEGAGIVPDIICLSKGLTGGFLPLGATVVREPIFDAFLSEDRRRTLFHGHSYTANPIACAAARASLALLDAACAARRDAIAAIHERRIGALASHPRVRRPRVLGTVAAFDLAGSDAGGYLSDSAAGLTAFALERGVLLRPLGDVIYVLPPYAITDAELGQVYDVIQTFLAAHAQ
jgi:adenosylmethionine-8-amino-7-oxononanoate aminotransferase